MLKKKSKASFEQKPLPLTDLSLTSVGLALCLAPVSYCGCHACPFLSLSLSFLPVGTLRHTTVTPSSDIPQRWPIKKVGPTYLEIINHPMSDGRPLNPPLLLLLAAPNRPKHRPQPLSPTVLSCFSGCNCSTINRVGGEWRGGRTRNQWEILNKKIQLTSLTRTRTTRFWFWTQIPSCDSQTNRNERPFGYEPLMILTKTTQCFCSCNYKRLTEFFFFPEIERCYLKGVKTLVSKTERMFSLWCSVCVEGPVCYQGRRCDHGSNIMHTWIPKSPFTL